MARCTLGDYETAKTANYGKNAIEGLSGFEVQMLRKTKLMKIIGKNSNPVSVLIPKAVEESLDILVDFRSTSQLPQDNLYLFGAHKSTGFLDPYPLFKKYSERYELEQPLKMRATRLRHHLATSLHALSTDEHDLERVAEYM